MPYQAERRGQLRCASSRRERAALALTDAVTLIADTHVPAAAYDQAARHFDAQELAHLIWQIAAINA